VHKTAKSLYTLAVCVNFKKFCPFCQHAVFDGHLDVRIEVISQKDVERPYILLVVSFVLFGIFVCCVYSLFSVHYYMCLLFNTCCCLNLFTNVNIFGVSREFVRICGIIDCTLLTQ